MRTPFSRFTAGYPKWNVDAPKCVAALAACVLLIAAAGAAAQQQRVVDRLLDILLANKQISPQQYQELKDQAEQERQEDVRTAAATLSPTPSATSAAAPSPQAVAAVPPTPIGDTARAYFKNGFNLETGDRKFQMRIGSFVQTDWNVSDPGKSVKQQFKLTGSSSGVEFRRARIYTAGLLYGNIDYKFEYDFAEQTGGQPSFKDVYLGMNQIPVIQYIRIGHFKEPFSLEELALDAYTTFQERSLANAFALPGFPQSSQPVSGTDRNTGVAAYQTFLYDRLTFATGGFRVTDNFGNGFGSDSPYDLTSRLTGLPIYDVDNHYLLHLGFSYSHKFRHYAKDSQETISFASRPESHLFPVNLVSTGNIPTNGADLLNPEVAFVTGPFAIQGEYTWALIDQSDLLCTSNSMGAVTCANNQHSNPMFNGGYIEASYFLTGESRANFYKPQAAIFDRVYPIHNFSIDGSQWGAWQVAARYSYLNLESASIKPTSAKPVSPSFAPGALDDITAGINWYMNPVIRLTINYVWAHRESIGDSNVVEGRFQLVW